MAALCYCTNLQNYISCFSFSLAFLGTSFHLLTYSSQYLLELDSLLRFPIPIPSHPHLALSRDGASACSLDWQRHSDPYNCYAPPCYTLTFYVAQNCVTTLTQLSGYIYFLLFGDVNVHFCEVAMVSDYPDKLATILSCLCLRT